MAPGTGVTPGVAGGPMGDVAGGPVGPGPPPVEPPVDPPSPGAPPADPSPAGPGPDEVVEGPPGPCDAGPNWTCESGTCPAGVPGSGPGLVAPAMRPGARPTTARKAAVTSPKRATLMTRRRSPIRFALPGMPTRGAFTITAWTGRDGAPGGSGAVSCHAPPNGEQTRQRPVTRFQQFGQLARSHVPQTGMGPDVAFPGPSLDAPQCSQNTGVVSLLLPEAMCLPSRTVVARYGQASGSVSPSAETSGTPAIGRSYGWCHRSTPGWLAAMARSDDFPSVQERSKAGRLPHGMSRKRP